MAWHTALTEQLYECEGSWNDLDLQAAFYDAANVCPRQPFESPGVEKVHDQDQAAEGRRYRAGRLSG